MNIYKLKVDNISCSNCAKSIKNAFKQANGNSEVKVNINNNMVFVKTDLTQNEVENVLKKAGYPVVKEQKAKENQLKHELIASIVLSIPLLISMFGHISMFKDAVPMFFMNPILMLVLATPVQFYIGRRYYIGAYHGIKNKVLGMDFLVAFSTTITYFYSLYLLIAYGGDKPMYFEVSALIITIVLLGKTIEDKAKRKTNVLIEGLAKLRNTNVTLQDGSVTDVDFVEIGSKYQVLANEKISLDGIITEGETYVDESTFTGESNPVLKQVGDEVVGGSINLESKIIVETTKDSDDNLINQIINSVEEASLIDTKYQRMADKVSGYFVPIVIIISVITLVFTLYTGASFSTAFEHAIAVIVISCPCSLGLATPTSIMVSNSISASEGVLYKGSKFFEIADQIKVLCFDKTGTITKGEPEVSVFSIDPQFEDMIYAIESQSVHPISKAVCKYLGEREEKYNFKIEVVKGIGLIAQSDGMVVKIGNKKMLDENSSEYRDASNLEKEALAVNIVEINGDIVGMYGVRDNVKPDAKKVITKLKELGIKPIMITGDNDVVAAAISKEVGIEEYYASTLPDDKSNIVKAEQAKGQLVGFVGDGVNDSIALSVADLAISVKNGNDLAIKASDVTLMDEDLNLIITGLLISKLTRRNIKHNFLWAFSYNIIAIPLAATGYLNMVVAAIAMGFSSIVVVLNALHLRREYDKYVKGKKWF